MSDIDLEQLKNNLEETREIVERNNELLQSIERTMFWRRVFTVFYWVVIIGIAIGLFYFLEPYADRVIDAYNQLQGQVETLPGVGGESQ